MAATRAPRATALTSLVLGGAGELLVRSNASPRAGALLLAAGGACLAIGASFGAHEGEAREKGGGRVFLAVAAFAGAALCAAAVLLLLGRDFESHAAVRLWGLALALLAAGGIVAGGWLGIPPAWRTPALPAGTKARRALAAAVLVVVVLGGAARLAGLATIPGGINPDEGDRAAVALQRIERPNPPTVFGRGWYHISNVYFALLGAFMKTFGTGVAGARTLGAVSGTVSVALLILFGARHFGFFTGLAAGGLYALWGAGLMFARENTEAGPTALLWTISVGFLLEAARTNRVGAWVGASVAGGLSIYFYPPGRVFAVFLVFVGAGLVLAAGRRGWARVLAGVAVGLLALFVTVAPFVAAMAREPGEFGVRAYETTIFRRQNRARLPYLNPDWSPPRFVAAQVERSLGLFNRFGDANFFWPIDRPAATPGLSALLFMGLFAALLRIRDRRLFVVVTWFATGLAGIVFTVETPALQRLSCGVSAVPLLAALALDELRRRFSVSPRASRAATAAAAAGVLLIAAAEGHRFFVKVGARELWPFPNAEGRAVASIGRDAWAFSVGDMYHMVLSGWVDLLAHDTARRGILTPGAYLPAPLEPDRDLAFVVYTRQLFFLPYLKELYPGGATRAVKLDDGTPVVSVYRVGRERWAATRGAVLRDPSGRTTTVSTLGAPPPTPSAARHVWSARLRVPRSGNYLFVTRKGHLVVDGWGPDPARAGGDESAYVVFLPRGDHAVRFEGTGARDASDVVLFGEADPGADEESRRAAARPIPRAALEATEDRERGLLGRVEIQGRPAADRLDSAIASGSFNDELAFHDPYRIVWTGSIRVARPGGHVFVFFVNGVQVDLAVGALVKHVDGSDETTVEVPVDLPAGVLPVTLTLSALRNPAAFEWAWRDAGGETSLVPPSVLVPPERAGAGPPRSAAALGRPDERLPDREPEVKN